MSPSTITRVETSARLGVALAGLGLLAHGADVGAQTRIEIEGIRNFTKVETTIGCGGATAPEAMAELKEMGYVSVINFRFSEERGATHEAGQAAAEAAGMNYIHLPFAPAGEDAEATATRFLAEVTNADNLPAYLHCGSANRVGGLWMIKRVMVDGWDRPKTLAEAETIGLRSEAVRGFVTTYLENHAP